MHIRSFGSEIKDELSSGNTKLFSLYNLLSKSGAVFSNKLLECSTSVLGDIIRAIRSRAGEQLLRISSLSQLLFLARVVIVDGFISNL